MNKHAASLLAENHGEATGGRVGGTIRYDTIRYDIVYLTCSKKLTGSHTDVPLNFLSSTMWCCSHQTWWWRQWEWCEVQRLSLDYFHTPSPSYHRWTFTHHHPCLHAQNLPLFTVFQTDKHFHLVSFQRYSTSNNGVPLHSGSYFIQYIESGTSR